MPNGISVYSQYEDVRNGLMVKTPSTSSHPVRHASAHPPVPRSTIASRTGASVAQHPVPATVHVGQTQRLDEGATEHVAEVASQSEPEDTKVKLNTAEHVKSSVATASSNVSSPTLTDINVSVTVTVAPSSPHS